LILSRREAPLIIRDGVYAGQFEGNLEKVHAADLLNLREEGLTVWHLKDLRKKAGIGGKRRKQRRYP